VCFYDRKKVVICTNIVGVSVSTDVREVLGTGLLGTGLFGV
jgi:hypothetical protein